MENNVNKALNDFVKDDTISGDSYGNVEPKKKMIRKSDSIIERVDKIIITEDGRQLLREQY